MLIAKPEKRLKRANKPPSIHNHRMARIRGKRLTPSIENPIANRENAARTLGALCGCDTSAVTNGVFEGDWLMFERSIFVT